MAKLPWKPWHEVVRLRDDLRSGELALHMFAADLYEVLMQSGKRPVYENPAEFFALTFPTHNLRGLVRDVALRVAGKNDKAVRQLQLTYGGGKTHTLIALRHLHHDPDALPDVPAVQEFIQSIGERPTKALVAGLCFDKLDVEKGMEVRSPQGTVRVLKQPWSVLAYQIAGDDGLKLLHAEDKAEERESAPAENLLTQLLEIPVKAGRGVLVLIDEVLMYAREKVAQDFRWKDRLVNFFQYLTQAATKVDRCCVVASLLATDPAKSDSTGRQLLGELYAIFEREREEAVEPVVKEDVAEVLRRRFFTPESIENREVFRQHVIAALKGIADVDEQTRRQGSQAEERFLRSFPFHPDLTEVLYGKWTQLSRFQRTRGVLRTFALALRYAEKWDTSPLIGPAVFLPEPTEKGLSEAARELVAVADTEEHEGRAQAWTAILTTEFEHARRIQMESIGLKHREIEQAALATFLHSQPVGQSARTRDLEALLAATRPDKIELEKGLSRWAQSSFWLDDSFTRDADKALPGTWRLGNRPNLVQMHAVASKSITEDVVRARLLDEIGRTKKLTEGASGAGVKVHTLPTRPRDIEDDGVFHYAVLGPAAASESGKPSAEACRYLDETTGSEKPRVYRNAVLLLVPSREGLDVAETRVRDYLAWEQVLAELNRQQQDGNVDVARMQTLAVYMDKAKGRIPESIRQAYCVVVTVNEANDDHAFKINVSDDPHFATIKTDKRSRIKDTAIEADALLPGGPYNLWREGETTRRVKDLSGAFAQLPHLPKMLKAQAILDTLVDGCERGSFVLKLARPDHTFRTWWKSRPDADALADPALELVLPDAAELGEIAPALVAPKALPGLWVTNEVGVGDVATYFDGTKVVQVKRGEYEEPMRIPRAAPAIVHRAIEEAVQSGSVWMTSGPTSVLGEPVPTGTLTDAAVLRVPPKPIPAPDILPENLPDAWKDGSATALSLATALSQKAGQTLPWKTVRDAIDAALRARFLELLPDSGVWPCDFPAAQTVKVKVAAAGPGGGGGGGGRERPKVRIAAADLEVAEFQDLGDALPKLLEVKAKSNVPIGFRVEVSVGDGKEAPPEEAVAAVNDVLRKIKDSFLLG